MRDDSSRWDPPQDAPLDLTLGGLRLRGVTGLSQVLVSGPSVLGQTEPPLISWPAPAQTASYALSIRRDRVLIVNGPAQPEGWDAALQQAVTDMSDGYAVLELSGALSLEVLRRGTEISLEQSSQSVARLLFGLGTFVYRYQSETTVRLHVASAHRQALVKALTGAARQAVTAAQEIGPPGT